MAILLTILLIALVRQMGLGSLFGPAGGVGLAWLINRLEMMPGAETVSWNLNGVRSLNEMT